MEERLIELSTTLETAIANMAPAAWNALVLTARVNSILTLALSAVVLVAAVMLARKWSLLWEKAEEQDMEGPAVILVIIVGGVVCIAIGVLFMSATWIGLFNPEAQAVIDLLDKVRGE